MKKPRFTTWWAPLQHNSAKLEKRTWKKLSINVGKNNCFKTWGKLPDKRQDVVYITK